MTQQVIVIGAGLAGLMATRTLFQGGCSVTLLDNGPIVGGRMTTQTLSQGQADTGAQFITARSPEFQAQIDEWVHQGLVEMWSHNWSDGSLKRTFEDGGPRYIALNGMSTLMQTLASGLDDVHLKVEVKKIERLNDDLWQVTDQNGDTYSADTILITAPVPQSLTLLATSGILLTQQDQVALEHITYAPCLTGLFVVEGTVTLPEPGALQNFEETIYWMVDNKRKGISPVTTLTAHLDARYSRHHYESPDQDALTVIRQALQPYLGSDAKIVEEQLIKWPYAVPLTTYPHDFYQLEGASLFLAGDAFGGRGRVEGAYLSGIAAAQAVLETTTAS